MGSLFLFGGGWRSSAYVRTYWEFLRSASKEGRRKIVIVVAEQPELDKAETESDYRTPFDMCELSKDEVVFLYPSGDRPLTREQLVEHDPTGVFVAGGVTPFFHEALCRDKRWWDHLADKDVPYAGFSAGAVLLPETAIVGGWKLALAHKDVAIQDERNGEGLEYLDLRPGLGQVPFAVEAHASQWGTIVRLMHVVRHQLVSVGWAIDEDTMLKIEGDTLTVHGLGTAYRVSRQDDGSVRVEMFGGGAKRDRRDW
jgi:cyanophycinase